VLRFFENKTAAETASVLKVTEAAAHKRTSRALERLREFFSKRGVSSTSAIIGATISAHSIHTAPAALAKSVTILAAAKGMAATGSILTLVNGALKVMAWTKAQMAIAAGAAVILTVGSATIAVKEIAAHRTPAWQEKYDVSVLDRLPAQVAIRPSLPATVSSGTHAASLGRGNKCIGWGQSMKDIFMAAYGYRFHLAQLNFSTPPPRGKYDYISNLPHNPQEALQEELKRQFGLAAHIETNEVDCLVLQVKNRNAPGLKRSTLPFSGSQQDDSYSGHGQVLWGLVDYLADHLGTVVINRTKLTGSYDVDFKWDKTPDGLKQALLEQTGLELVPSTEPVEFLVVEDLNHPVVGIGAALAPDAPTHAFRIMKVFPNSPAVDAGLSAGCIIQKIDGNPVADIKLAQCVDMIRGPAGTKVQIEFVTPDGSQTNTVELIRQKIQL
jgi:uncharacterized protein (TIGR03435 family)